MPYKVVVKTLDEMRKALSDALEAGEEDAREQSAVQYYLNSEVPWNWRLASVVQGTTLVADGRVHRGDYYEFFFWCPE